MDDKRKNIVESYVNAYNAFDVDGMVKDVHPDVVFENITNDEVNLTTKGSQAFKAQAEKAKSYFSHRKQSIQSWHFDRTSVKIQIDYNAILAIDLPNGMKKGDTLQLSGESVFEFQNDLIVKIQDKS